MITARFNKLTLIMAIIITAAMTCVADDCLPPPATIANAGQRSLLFNVGDMGSKFWRIPALATTPSGTVIAAADRRNDSNRDLPNNIDIVIRRSTDSGHTWSLQQIVMKADEVGGYGDAALGVHNPSGHLIMVAAHGNGIWEATPTEREYVVVTRSEDDGATWSEPVDITDQLFHPIEGKAPVKAYAGFASSGTMLCDSDGRLWFVLVARTAERKWGPLECYLCFSDDGGHTWSINPTPIDCDGDESKIAQLADGSYLVSIRNRYKGERKVTRSVDGMTWTPLELQPDLVDPACNGDLIALSPERVELLGLSDAVGNDGLLIHSLACDRSQRRNVSILTSSDMGVTWEKRFTITPYASAYSALTLLPDGSLGCLTEEQSTEEGYRLWFTKITMDQLFGR